MMVVFFIIFDYIVNWVFQYLLGVIGNYVCMFIIGGNFVWVGMVVFMFFLVVVVFECYVVVVYFFNERW